MLKKILSFFKISSVQYFYDISAHWINDDKTDTHQILCLGSESELFGSFSTMKNKFSKIGKSPWTSTTMARTISSNSSNFKVHFMFTITHQPPIFLGSVFCNVLQYDRAIYFVRRYFSTLILVSKMLSETFVLQLHSHQWQPHVLFLRPPTSSNIMRRNRLWFQRCHCYCLNHTNAHLWLHIISGSLSIIHPFPSSPASDDEEPSRSNSYYTPVLASSLFKFMLIILTQVLFNALDHPFLS